MQLKLAKFQNQVNYLEISAKVEWKLPPTDIPESYQGNLDDLYQSGIVAIGHATSEDIDPNQNICHLIFGIRNSGDNNPHKGSKITIVCRGSEVHSVNPAVEPLFLKDENGQTINGFGSLPPDLKRAYAVAFNNLKMMYRDIA